MPNPTFYIVSLAAIVSLFFYKNFKNTLYKYFIFYMFFVFIIEILNAFRNFYYFQTGELLYKTHPLYGLYAIVTFIFYFLFYKSLFRKKKNKNRMNLFLLLYILFIPFDMLILKTNFINDFFVNNLIFGSILLIITLILFLIEIINDERIVFNIKKSFIFWISVGALLFYIGATPIIITSKYLNFGSLYHKILTVLNIIMYGCFITGFILSDKKYNY